MGMAHTLSYVMATTYHYGVSGFLLLMLLLLFVLLRVLLAALLDALNGFL